MAENKKIEKTLSIDEIPFDGSLGLLAIGDLGVKIWREARKKKLAEMNIKTKENEQKKG